MPAADDLRAALEHLVINAYPAPGPGVALLLVQNGQELYRQAVGLANLEHQVPLTTSMPFRLASLTKPLTAAAILLLAETGQLELSDPLTRFLPDYPPGETAITIEHLLTHTSGIRNYTELPEWWAVHRQDLNLEQLIDLFKAQPQAFAPGTRWAYCNSGYVLLGAIIEKISGKPYGDFMAEHIFTPLGMTHTFYEAPVQRIIPQLVNGYTQIPGGYLLPEYISYTQVYAAGGLVSTLDDLATWFTALRAGKLLSPAMLQRAWTPYRLADGSSARYGYGWMLGEYAGQPVVEHYGFLPGYVTYLLALPAADILVLILSNDDGKLNVTEQLAFEMAAQALGQPYQPPAVLKMDAGELARFVGAYTAADGDLLTILAEAEGLVLQTAAGQRLALQPCAPLEFFCPQNPLSRLSFSADAAGQITELAWAPRRGIPLSAQKTSPTSH